MNLSLLSLSRLGEERPQPFIILDLDRQVDGKLVISNHISVSPPNGRLPVSSNYYPNNLSPLPSHIAQPTPTAVPTYALDGGVYQGGQAPMQLNPKVNSFTGERNFFKNDLDHWSTICRNSHPTTTTTTTTTISRSVS